MRLLKNERTFVDCDKILSKEESFIKPKEEEDILSGMDESIRRRI
jgi:hypothetical protein